MGRTLILLLFWVGTVSSGSKVQPLFLNNTEDWEKISDEKQIFSFYNRDSTQQHEMSVLEDSVGLPLLFYSDIRTPVCIDGICKPVYIEMYWDLTGTYFGFGVREAEPLTKYDHEEFEAPDYEKLHALLNNAHAPIARKELSELTNRPVDSVKQITYNGVEVDAVSGATVQSIKEMVVQGALYSCYTLWHLAYGEATLKTRAYLRENLSETLVMALLGSDDGNYRFEALKLMRAADMHRYKPELISLFEQANPMTRKYLLKKMPDAMWADPAMAAYLYARFRDLDFNSKTLLINRVRSDEEKKLVLLSQQVDAMSKNQLKLFLSQVSDLNSDSAEKIYHNLRACLADGKYSYNYLIEKHLQNQ